MRSQNLATLALLIGITSMAFVANARAAESDLGELACSDELKFDRPVERAGDLHARYPEGQLNHSGEAWVRFQVAIGVNGSIEGYWLEGAVGSPLFIESSRIALGRARYAPALLKGTPVARYSDFVFEYRMMGDNRAGVHLRFQSNYERARELRSKGRHAEALAVLRDNDNISMNLYEHAVTAYGLAMTYLGMSDWRRALRHLRYATLEDGSHIDRAQFASAMALRAELEIRDGGHRDAICVHKALLKRHPDFKASPALQQALTVAAREMSGSATLRTEVELIEPIRPDVPAHWSHRLHRGTFRFESVTGKLTQGRLVCPTRELKFDAIPTTPVVADASVGPCTLFVFGEPGARFVLEER